MKILIAPDSFKNSLSSLQVARNIAKGLSACTVSNTLDINIQQLSDGGEGALNIFLDDSSFKIQEVWALNPIGENIKSLYLINPEKKVAFIEMAQISGLELLSEEYKNPKRTTSYGVGQLILHAYKKGIREFVISVGGSATNDGGAGMLSALGIDFSGIKNKTISNADLINLNNVSLENVKIRDCKFKILTDVNNPLLGNNGATQIYAKQKGATKTDIIELENNLINFADIIEKFTHKKFRDEKGMGAAGGIAFGFKSFFDVEIVSGISEIMKFCDLEKKIKEADLIITGEGSIDFQSLNGKLISGVANLCKQNNKPFILIGGKIDYNIIKKYYNLGCISAFSIQDRPQSIDDSIKRAPELLENLGKNIAYFLTAFNDFKTLRPTD